MLTQHFVTFFSPGTFVAETTMKPIASWDVDAAVAMAREITERYNATPYAFRFTTRGRDDSELDSKQIAASNLYYLGGQVFTRAEIEARNDPKEATLRANMRINDIERVIINDNSWRFTGPLNADDVILDFTPLERVTA
jgi:hypothetical protein